MERGQLYAGISGQSVFTEQYSHCGLVPHLSGHKGKKGPRAMSSDEEEGLRDSEELKYAG